MRERITDGMSAISRIRTEVLGLSQAALAAMTGVSQATVSRWEKGELHPSLPELEAIRTAARAKRPNEWSDSWLFEGPAPQSAVGAQPQAIAS